MKNAADFLDEPVPQGYLVGIHAFAKINLGFRILSRRDDGFHEIDTVFQTIDLADSLFARPRKRGFKLRVERRGPARRAGLKVESGPKNLVLRAARLLAEELGEERGAEILLIKRIPAGSGLGGGSSDVAATLRLLPRLWNRDLGVRIRSRLSSVLGSDCAFFVRGGRARARGRGEKLRWLRISRSDRLILAMPHVGVSTSQAYRHWDDLKSLTVSSSGRNLHSPPRALSGRGGSSARSLMPNELEEVVSRHYPEVGRAKELLELPGVRATGMSGSGSAVFGILSPYAKSNTLVPKQLQSSLEMVLARYTRVGSRWIR